jgi:hypothetical protein
MKAMDRAAAVSQQLRMWEYLIAEKGQLGADQGPFRLGRLLEVEIPVRPPEQAWLQAPADDDELLDEVEDDNELRLFSDPEGPP